MNLSSKIKGMENWNNTEVTQENTNVGDVIVYMDACNYETFTVIEKDEDSVVIEATDDPDYLDAKFFSEFNQRWAFHKKA